MKKPIPANENRAWPHRLVIVGRAFHAARRVNTVRLDLSSEIVNPAISLANLVISAGPHSKPSPIGFSAAYDTGVSFSSPRTEHFSSGIHLFQRVSKTNRHDCSPNLAARSGTARNTATIHQDRTSPCPSSFALKSLLSSRIQPQPLAPLTAYTDKDKRKIRLIQVLCSLHISTGTIFTTT